MSKSVFLLPVGAGRYELYSETSPAEPSAPPEQPEGFLRRRLAHARERWHHIVEQASARTTIGGGGRLTRWWDRLVCSISENIAEQRTLWSLRDDTHAVLVHPSTLDGIAAAAVRDAILVDRNRHHLRWFLLDTMLFVLSGALVLLPGPNVVAYYFAFRAVGHWLSWRGARRGLTGIEWATRSEPALTELDRLSRAPRDARAADVEAIASALNLPHLPAFFDRVSAPAA